MKDDTCSKTVPRTIALGRTEGKRLTDRDMMECNCNLIEFILRVDGLVGVEMSGLKGDGKHCRMDPFKGGA